MNTLTHSLRLAMQNALLGASKDDTMPMLNSVLFVDHGRGQTIMGTNRYVITRTHLPLKEGHTALTFALPVTQARLLDRFLAAVAMPKEWITLNISEDGERMTVVTDRKMRITLPLTQGTVPGVLPIFEKHEAPALREWTTSTLGFNVEYLERISKLRSETFHDLAMVFSPGKTRSKAVMFKLGESVDGALMPIRLP